MRRLIGFQQSRKENATRMEIRSHRRAGPLLAGVVSLALAGALAGCGTAPEVTVATVARTRLVAAISSNGKVEPIAPHVLRAQVPTFVLRVHATEGQTVRRGELLAELDGAEARAALARARAELIAAEDSLRAARAGGPAVELARIESELRKAEAEFDRQSREHSALERLAAQQAATREEVERAALALARAGADLDRLRSEREELARVARLDLERAQLLVERARNEIRSWEEKARSTRVAAPADGTLYSFPVREGDYLQTGAVVAEVARLERVRVRVFVDEPELAPLEAGQTVEITWDAAPARAWTGTVEQLPRQVVPRGTRSVGEVLCTIENEKLELLPNVNVQVRIITRQRENTLAAPRAAVRGQGDQRYVFVVENGRASRRAIRVGASSVEAIEVLDGLREGERVAVSSAVQLEEGMKVKAVDARPLAR
jgi:multidrug resistance efflux pump